MTPAPQPYPAYKPSGVEWLGDVPDHWDVRRLKQVCSRSSLYGANAPEAWYAPDSVKISYEISFTRHFYKPLPLRPLEEIRADILALERKTEGLLAEIVGDWGVEEYAR